MAAFSSSAFSTSSFSESAFDFGSVAPEETESRGGFDERDYKRYREHLERLTKVTSEEKKYPKRAVEAVEALSELPVEVEEAKKILERPVTKGTLSITPQIDYDLLLAEIQLYSDYLDKMEEFAKNKQQLDEEILLLLVI